MRIEVDRRQFIAALNKARPATDRRQSAPDVLGMMRMRVGDYVAIEANDLDIEITGKIALGEGQRCGEGDFMLPAPDALRGALKFLDGEMLTIEAAEGGTLKLRAGNQSIDVRSDKVGPEDFPAVAAPGLGAAMRVGAGFAAALRRLMPAVSEEETRYYLNGIAIRHLGDWSFRLAATDGHRLHVAQVEIPDAKGPFWSGDLIVSRRTLRQLVPMLTAAKDGADIAFGVPPRRNSDDASLIDPPPQGAVPTKVQVATDEVMLTGKLIDGTYPDYMRIVPGPFTCWIEVDRRALIRAVRIATEAMPGTKTRAVRLTLDAIGDIAVSSTFPVKESGIEAAVTIAAQQVLGLKVGEAAGFNGRYLLDALNSFGGDIVRIAWASENIHSDPCRLDDPADDKYFVVLMPMRV